MGHLDNLYGGREEGGPHEVVRALGVVADLGKALVLRADPWQHDAGDLAVVDDVALGDGRPPFFSEQELDRIERAKAAAARPGDKWRIP